MSAEHDEAKSRAPPTRPWASGRVLSAEQRERKRQANRNSNRFLKTELQNRMLALEDRVIQLEEWRTQAEATGWAASSSFPLDARAQSQPFFNNGQQSRHLYDNFFHVQGLDNSRDMPNWPLHPPFHLAQSEVGASTSTPGSRNNQRVHPVFGADFDNQQNNDQAATSPITSYPNQNLSNLKTQVSQTLPDSGPSPSASDHGPSGWATDGMEQPGNWIPGNSNASGGNGSSSIPDDVHATTLATISAPEVVPFVPLLDPDGRDITQMCNALVRYVRSLAQEAICLNDTYNQDVIVRAVLNGWDAATSKYPIICPLWRVIRYVDYQLFRRCNINERICVLRILHQMYFYEVLRNSKFLPPWYKPRPSQLYLEHEEVVDHLAWPGLRERLSIAENNTLTNRFWYAFGHNFRFIWPRSPLEAFHLRPGTTHYQISADFAGCMQDIGRYRMHAAFFAQFPLLYDDIGTAEYMPLTWLRPAAEGFLAPRLEEPGGGQQGAKAQAEEGQDVAGAL